MIEQIPDASLTASSYHDLTGADHGPVRSRFATLNDGIGIGAWAAGQDDTLPWIQAEFLSVKTISKVATKGRDGNRPSQWVTKYQLKYSLLGNEADFEYVTSSAAEGGDVITFNGNSDQDTVVENEFSTIFAQFFRLYPTEWVGHISLRWEVYGC